MHSTFEGNAAEAGGLSSMAGAVFVDEGKCFLSVTSCLFLMNSACDAVESVGGALVLGKGTEAHVQESTLLKNTAKGSNAKAGAILSTAQHLHLVKSTVDSNTVHALAGEALGGGLYVELGVSSLDQCSVLANTARMDPTARRANAGGVYVGQGGAVGLFQCTIHANAVEGLDVSTQPGKRRRGNTLA